MSGYIRQINSSDGEPITAPTSVNVSVAGWEVFANDAAYEAVYGAGSQGDAYFNSTELLLRQHNGTAWVYNQNGINALEDSTSTGSDQDIDPTYNNLVKLTNASLATVRSLDPGQTNICYLSNATGSDILLLNESAGATAANRLTLPGAATFTLEDGNTVHFVYDSLTSRWRFTNAAGSAAGGSGVGGKNYILNPSAADDATTGVTNTATSGSWTIAQTTTASELPEESLSSAFKISGSGLTVGDTVKFAIIATGIDDADGGRFGRARVAVKDISTTINGEYSIQVYDVTNSVYVGDEDTITGTGVYYLDVPLTAEGDYEFHLIAQTANPTNIGLSTITIEPVSQTVAGVVGKTVTDTIAFTTGASGTTTQEKIHHTVNGTYLFVDVDYQHTAGGSSGAGDLRITMPGNYTIDGTRCVINDSSPSIEQDAKMIIGKGHYASAANLAADNISCNFFAYSSTEIGILLENSAGTGSIVSAAVLGNTNLSFSGMIRVPVAELANAHTPTASDVQYENARARVGITGDTTWTNATDLVFNEEVHLKGGMTFDNTTGDITVPTDGEYFCQARVTVGAITSPGGDPRIQINVNNSGKIFTYNEPESVTDRMTITVGDVLELSAGDVLSVYNSIGATVTAKGGISGAYTAFTVTRVSDYSARKASLPFPNGTVRLDTGNGYGSTNTKIRRFSNETAATIGDAFTYADSSTLGMSVTVNRDCVASISYTDGGSVATNMGISLNSSQLTTNIDSITVADRLIAGAGISGTLVQNMAVTIKLEKGDIIRAHTDGGTNSTLSRTQFVVQELYPLGN